VKQHYRDLVVWQRAIHLVPEIYRLVQRLPKHETYALGDQMRRAAVSIPANIAEGQARQHPREFLQHLAIAKGSLAELDTLLIVAEKLGYLDAESLQRMQMDLGEIGRPLNGLMAKLASPRTGNQQPTTPSS
jgi:four helix bundle protein